MEKSPTETTLPDGWRCVAWKCAYPNCVIETGWCFHGGLAVQDDWQPIETAPRASEDEDDIWIWAARRGSKLPMLTTWDHDERQWYTFNLALETGMRRHDPVWKWEPNLWMPVQEVPQ